MAILIGHCRVGRLTLGKAALNPFSPIGLLRSVKQGGTDLSQEVPRWAKPLKSPRFLPKATAFL